MEKFLREPHYEKYSVRASLKSIYGVGKKKWNMSFACLGVPYTRSNYKFTNLGRSELYRIGYFLDKTDWDIGEYLQNIENEDRLFLSKINCYRHYRFKLGLPCRGQRTKTNAGTSKRRNRNTKTYKKFSKRQLVPFNKRGGVSL